MQASVEFEIKMNENIEISIRPATNADCDRVKQLVFGVLHEHGLKPSQSEDSDLDDLEANYVSRGGLFEVLEDQNGALLGTVALYPINEKTVQLRKMYFAKHLRGRGYGKITLQRVIQRAKELGFERMYLETSGVLEAAIGLYQSFGFETTDKVNSPRCDRAFSLIL